MNRVQRYLELARTMDRQWLLASASNPSTAMRPWHIVLQRFAASEK